MYVYTCLLGGIYVCACVMGCRGGWMGCATSVLLTLKVVFTIVGLPLCHLFDVYAVHQPALFLWDVLPITTMP